MTDKEAEKANVGKAEPQIRREDGLKVPPIPQK